MRNFANPNSPANESEPEELLDDLDVEISDLDPATRSHHLLLNLKDLRRRLQTNAQHLLEQIASSSDHAQGNDVEIDDDFELEMSDLPPRKRSHHVLLKLTTLQKRLRPASTGSEQDSRTTSRTRRARIGQALTAFCLCLALLVLLLGNAPGLRTQLFGAFLSPTPTPQATATYPFFGFRSESNSRVVVRGSSNIDFSVTNSRETPGLLPESCPRTTSLERFQTPLDPSGVGGGPLWITGFAGPTAALLDLQPVPSSVQQPTQAFFGWYATITLFIQKDFPKPVLLLGGEQTTARPLAFGDPGTQSISNQSYQVYLNASNSDSSKLYTPSGQWEVRALNVFIRAAGCYFLQASWDGGMWLAYFAAGTHY